MSEDRITQLLALHHAYCERLNILELRKAELGPAFPSGQQLELEQAKRDRDLVAAELHLLSPSPEARSATSDEARWLLVEWRFQTLSKRVDDALKQFERKMIDYQTADATARVRSQLGLRLILGLILILLFGLLGLQLRG